MMIIKKSSRFIALILVALMCNTYTMEPEHKKIGWVALAGAAIVGGYMAYKRFLSSVHGEQTPEFSNLSLETQYYIIDLLAKVSTATSLPEAAHTINSLAQVNHDLNDLINDPQFCLRIIKNLAKQFDCSDMKAALVLQTKEAKRRVALQQGLILCCIPYITTAAEAGNAIKELIKDGVDFSFTVNIQSSAIFGFSVKVVEPIEVVGPIWFSFCLHPHVITALVAQGININEQASNGESILLYTLRKQGAGLKAKIKSLKEFFELGADPEIADNNGVTLLQIAQDIGNQELINLIQTAIDEKHRRK